MLTEDVIITLFTAAPASQTVKLVGGICSTNSRLDQFKNNLSQTCYVGGVFKFSAALH